MSHEPFTFARRAALASIAMLSLAACAHPVSVSEPEVAPANVDLTPISATGDTSWRVAATEDLRDRVHTISHHDSSLTTLRAPGGPSAPAAPPPAKASVSRMHFADITPESVNEMPSEESFAASEGPTILRAQVLLDRAHFSVGTIDGRDGQNTQKALYFFQQEHALPTTGKLDSATFAALMAHDRGVDGVRKVELDAQTLRGPFTPLPGSVYDQANLQCLCYQIPIEMLSERFHTVPAVLHQLNPTVNFDKLAAGDALWVPDVEPFPLDDLKGTGDAPRVAKIHVSKSGEYVHALAADGSIIYHFPTTVGSKYDPSPSGTYHVTGVQWTPIFRYDPTLYSDVPDDKPKATLPAGPNSPVGIVWIALSKEHVGIHGTPRPDTIGLTSSHGCVRLTNWDATELARSVRDGVPVEFVD